MSSYFVRYACRALFNSILSLFLFLFVYISGKGEGVEERKGNCIHCQKYYKYCEVKIKVKIEYCDLFGRSSLSLFIFTLYTPLFLFSLSNYFAVFFSRILPLFAVVYSSEKEERKEGMKRKQYTL